MDIITGAKVVNLTSHTITELTTGISYPTSGVVARADTKSVKVQTINGIPVYKTELLDIVGLPEPVEGTIYVVSALTLKIVPDDRTDVVATGNPQRNEFDKIIGCKGFRAKG